MNKISDPQYGDNFVGRGEKINELKEKIEKNGIVVITGDRGIGKTNLMLVVKEDMGKEKECHFVNGSLFYEEMDKIFKPPWYKRIHGFSASLIAGGGISWDPMKPFILENIEKSEEKMIFVENAQEMDKKALETIFDGSRRNDQLKFVLEIATPYMRDVKLRAGSYEIVKLDELNDKSIEEIVRKGCPNFSDAIVNGVVQHSKGYPYVARSIAYICDNKNAEEEMFKFLNRLSYDDMKFNLGKIHKEVLETLNPDSQEVIKELAIAPATLTLKLIEAFCGENVDTPLTDIKERGILVEPEEKFYQIYHPIFREFLRDIQPIALQNKRELYCKAMGKVKADFDLIYILLEVLNEPDIFVELIKLTENYEAINFIGIQSNTWGKLDQAIYVWDHLLEKTKGVDKEWEPVATGNIGIVYLTQGELDKALEYFEKALELNEELRNEEGMTAAFGNIGNVYLTKGELNKALEYFEKSLELNDELGSEGGMAVDFGNIGIVYLTQGELDKALEYFENALELDKELGRKEGIANQLGNIGIVYADKGELEKAREYYKKALELNGELGRKEGRANQLGNIGIVYQGKGELDNALEYFEEALKVDKDLGNKEGIAADLGNIGNVYRIKEELDNALEYYGKALEIFKDMSIRIETAKTLMNLGDVFTLKSDEKRALDYYLEARDLAKGSSVFEEINKRINNIRSK